MNALTSPDGQVDFPILCESCLGDNPYMRMTTQSNGSACKNCNRPFTIYRWTPGTGKKSRRTEICSSCAKLKNACQSCILDLELGLSIRVRDAVLGGDAASTTSSEANRRWLLRTAESSLSKTGKSMVDYGKMDSIAKETLKNMSRQASEPYGSSSINRRPPICNLWLKGKCTRGRDCSYRHELPKNKEKLEEFLAKQRAKEQRQMQASSVPKGQKILERHLEEHGNAQLNSTTLLVSSLPSTATSEETLRSHFEGCGEIVSIVISVAKRCAFVNFASREAAEAAIESEHVIDGQPFKATWGKNRMEAPPSSKATSSRPAYQSMNPAMIG